MNRQWLLFFLRDWCFSLAIVSRIMITLTWPLVYKINPSIGNLLLKLVMDVSRFDNIHLSVPCKYHVGIHHSNFNTPHPQIPPPPLIALEKHDAVNQLQLIRNVVIVHLGVVFVQQVGTKKILGHVLFQGVTLHKLIVINPCYLLSTVQQNVEGIMIEARYKN